MHADFSNTEDTEEFEPLGRAKDRLAKHIFNNYSIMPDENELSAIVIDIMPYIACHLALFQANEATQEIVRRAGTG